MKLKELQTIDAEELASQPLPPPSFIVDGLIPYGLCVLAGPSKCGKSWLMLWLCMRVSQGLPIWERKTQQCDVLYLCLEDTYARIQRRMYRLNEESVPELRLGVISEKLHCGLEEQIEQHLSKYPKTKLVVIDTLQKVRKANSTDSNMYAADYEDISALKRIADQRSIAIVLVHHLRKLKDSSDPFNELSGSTGLMGALDTCLLMKRTNRAEETAKLLVTGTLRIRTLSSAFMTVSGITSERLMCRRRSRRKHIRLFCIIWFPSWRIKPNGSATQRSCCPHSPKRK